MKVGILAGGHGTRLAEETEIKPKPMVEIGGRPILWHIMMHYSCFGHNDFVIVILSSLWAIRARSSSVTWLTTARWKAI